MIRSENLFRKSENGKSLLREMTFGKVRFRIYINEKGW